MPGQTYYLSAFGDDAHPGTRERPWRTLERASQAGLKRGDTLVLKGGEVFLGPLLVQSLEGPEREFFTITSEGDTFATVRAGQGSGIEIQDGFGVAISRLHIEGEGVSRNFGYGIRVRRETGGVRGGVRIASVEISGFGEGGISVEGAARNAGFYGVHIESSRVHQVGGYGIAVQGIDAPAEPGYTHADVRIMRCEVREGIGARAPHPGSGIVLRDAHGGLIDGCKSFDNGSFGGVSSEGPIGIWAGDCRNVTIQHCESFRNRTPTSQDGAGFALVGSAIECVLRNNSARDNDGPAFQLVQALGRALHDNILHANRSEGDARRNNCGAIHLRSAGELGVRGVRIFENQILLVDASWGIPRGLRIQGVTVGVDVDRNFFVSQRPLFLADIEEGQIDFRFRDNQVQSGAGQVQARWGSRMYTDAGAWLNAAGQDQISASF